MNNSIQKVEILIRGIPFWPQIQTKAKYLLCTVVLSFFGSAFEVVGKRVPEFKAELAEWEDGRRFSFGVLPKGPYISLEKKGDMIYYLGKGLISPHISIAFKNLDSALMVFLGIMGPHQATAEGRILAYGNLAHTMAVNRIVNIVNTYLFPGIILKRVLKRPARLSMKQYIIKGKIYLSLMPAVIRHIVLNSIRHQEGEGLK